MSEDQSKEEKRRKLQMSQGKKKKKSKSKEGKMNQKENKEDDFAEETRDIDASLDPLFAEVGLKREEHKIYLH